MPELQIVSDAGYQALIALKDRRPALFTTPDPEKLKSAMPAIIKEGDPEALWAAPIPISAALEAINRNPRGGPVDDAANALILNQALPQLSLRDWSHERLWASLNCFALADWVPARWSTSRTKNTKESQFVHTHWLKANTDSRESNASMRLFTLLTLSRRAAAYSARSQEELLVAMAEKVNLFHQTLRRPFLLSNSRILAMVWDSALDDLGSSVVFQTKAASSWLSKINERGGAVDLGILDDDGLRSVVAEAKPRPKAPPLPATDSPAPPALRVLSLGGGVQSTVMALLAERGAFGVKPDCAIFADTRWEPGAVYRNLRWLRSQVSYTIYTAHNGRNLKDDVMAGVNARGRPWLTIPAYLADADATPAGVNWRQCTTDYKIVPIQRKIQRMLGLSHRQPIPEETNVEMWVGITTDEALRVKPSRNWWINHRYPLIDDLPMTREQCLDWFAEQYPKRTLTRSACVGCPFRSAASWLDIMQREPELYQEAVEIDALLRSPEHNAGQMFRKNAYLHHRRIPLAQAIRLDTQEQEINGFINECEGHCGV